MLQETTIDCVNEPRHRKTDTHTTAKTQKETEILGPIDRHRGMYTHYQKFASMCIINTNDIRRDSCGYKGHQENSQSADASMKTIQLLRSFPY